MFSSLAVLALAAVCLVLVGSLAPPQRKRETSPAPNTALSVTLPLSVPISAHTLERSLISFSIEGDRWPEWAGTNSTNTFFTNALNNVGKITGRTPDVRVGASPEDRTTLDESVNLVHATFLAPSNTTPYPEAHRVIVSSEYYQLSKNMPPGTHMIWGVNFGSNNISNAVAQVKAIAATFASGGAANSAGVILDSIEIGNDADLYKYNGLRGPSYDINQYAEEWQTFARDIINATGLQPNTTPTLILASFAHSDNGAGGFSPQMLYQRGVLSGPLGNYISVVSQHHYSGAFHSNSSTLLSDLMAKDAIRGNISQFDGDISASVSRGLTYIFGETNSYSGHGAPGVSNAAGAAIWALDYALQAATHGIRRVYFHEGIGFSYNLIQPVNLTRSITNGAPLSSPLAPHIQPQYYAAIVAATFIGNSKNGTVTTNIVELPAPNSTVAGYAAYDNGVLARAVFINSKTWLNGTTGSRGIVQLDFPASQNGTWPSNMQIRRLGIGYADDTSGLTFAGQSYETSTALPYGDDTCTTVKVSDGLSLNDTEAVVLTFLY